MKFTLILGETCSLAPPEIWMRWPSYVRAAKREQGQRGEQGGHHDGRRGVIKEQKGKGDETHIVSPSLDLLVQLVLVLVPERRVTHQQDVENHPWVTNTHKHVTKHTHQGKNPTSTQPSAVLWVITWGIPYGMLRLNVCVSLQLTAGPDVHRFAICLLPQYLRGKVSWCSCKPCRKKKSTNDLQFQRRQIVQLLYLHHYMEKNNIVAIIFALNCWTKEWSSLYLFVAVQTKVIPASVNFGQ